MTLRACLQANCIALIIIGLLRLSRSPSPDRVDITEKEGKEVIPENLTHLGLTLTELFPSKELLRNQSNRTWLKPGTYQPPNTNLHWQQCWQHATLQLEWEPVLPFKGVLLQAAQCEWCGKCFPQDQRQLIFNISLEKALTESPAHRRAARNSHWSELTPVTPCTRFCLRSWKPAMRRTTDLNMQKLPSDCSWVYFWVLDCRLLRETWPPEMKL